MVGGRLRRAPLIPVVEPTDFRNRDDRPGRCSRNRSAIRRVFLQTEVRAGPMVVMDVAREDAPEMRLVENDHVIETFTADRSEMKEVDDATFIFSTHCRHSLQRRASRPPIARV